MLDGLPHFGLELFRIISAALTKQSWKNIIGETTISSNALTHDEQKQSVLFLFAVSNSTGKSHLNLFG